MQRRYRQILVHLKFFNDGTHLERMVKAILTSIWCLFIIQEIFVGGNRLGFEGGGGVTVGDEILILYSTDTGDREDLPSRLNDTEGFLGVLNRVGYCFVDGEYVEASMVHTMNDCNFLSNIPWSDVSEKDRELLRGGELEVASNAFSSTLASFRTISILVAAITLF